MEILQWIQQWYANECDGDWEHEYGIKISTVDNPGWLVEIDLAFINIEINDIEFTRVEHSEEDWHFFQIKGQVYRAGGDPSKLSMLLEKFREIIISYTNEIA